MMAPLLTTTVVLPERLLLPEELIRCGATIMLAVELAPEIAPEATSTPMPLAEPLALARAIDCTDRSRPDDRKRSPPAAAPTARAALFTRLTRPTVSAPSTATPTEPAMPLAAVALPVILPVVTGLLSRSSLTSTTRPPEAPLTSILPRFIDMPPLPLRLSCPAAPTKMLPPVPELEPARRLSSPPGTESTAQSLLLANTGVASVWLVARRLKRRSAGAAFMTMVPPWASPKTEMPWMPAASGVAEPAVIVLAAVIITVPPTPPAPAEALMLATVAGPLSASTIILPPGLL